MGKELANYDEEYARYAEQYNQQEATGGSWITTRGGILRFQDEELPGNQAAVIVLDAIHENTYYPDKFDPDAQVPPRCFAFGRTTKDMAPDPALDDSDWFERQAEQCAGCPMNEFGSAETGRGKACKNRRRLAVIPVGFYSKKRGSRDFDLELFEEEAAIKESDIAFLKLPPTSAKEWAKYVRQIGSQFNKPPFAVATRLYIEPDPKTQFKIKFELIEELPDEWAQTVFARNEEAAAIIEQPYEEPSDDD